MRTRLTSRLSLLIFSFAMVLLVFPATAFAAVLATDGTTSVSAPTIQSDQDDYPPGATVTLTGSGWQPGESVHIYVNDDQGQTWSRDSDVTTDANGQIQDQFQLPDWFVATYSVKATGASGALATTSFLDSNVQVGANLSTGNSTNVQWQRYTSTDCTGTALTGANNTGTLTLNGSATSPITGGATSGSIKLTADLQSSPAATKKAFNIWVPSGSATSANVSAVSGSGNNVICTSGFNSGNNTHIYTANYGNTAPSTPGTPSASSNPNQGAFTLSWTASTDTEGNPITYRLEHKSVSDTSYSLVTGAGSLSTNSFSFTSAAQEDEGTWTYRVQASDSSTAGNLSSAFSADSAAIKVDKTAPETTINSKPADPTNSTSASFGFSSNETGSTFQCSIDNGSFSNCTSPKSYSSLTNGSHTFQVRATDAAGNVESTPASYTWTIDRTAPLAPVISSPANNSSVGASFTLSGTAEANSTIELFEGTTSKGTTQADANGNWSKALSGVSEGSHTYTAKATDAAGNTSAASSSRTVIVDTTAPTATITSGPASGSTVNSSSASFSFSSNETGSTFQCSLDGGTYTTCTSPQNYTNLSDGSHTFSVKATDVAGNTGSPVSRTWTVSTDSTAPTSTASAKNADNSTYNSGDWTKQNVTVSLSATDSGSGVKEITYSASGAQTIAQNTQAGNSVTLPVINTEGTTTVTYKATDNNGNVEANNTFTVKIDKTAPVISGADVNDTTWRNTDRSASFTASDPSSGLANSADASFTLTASQESANATTPTTVSKTVTDAAGNSATRTLSAKIDKTAPSVTVGSATTQPNQAGWYKSAVTNNFSASDGLSGLADATQASFQKSSGATEEGSAVTIGSGNVADVAGNVASKNAGPFKIDMTKPVISRDAIKSGTLGLNGWYKSDVGYGFTATDSLSGLATADQAFTKSTTGEGSAINVSSGTVTDQAGNVSDAIDSPDFKIDKTAPSISDDGPTTQPNAAGWYKSDVTNNFSSTDGVSGLANAADASLTRTTSGEGTAVKVASGSVSDVAGNVAPSIDSASFKVDKTAIPSKASAASYSNTTITVNYNTTIAANELSGLAKVELYVNGPTDGTTYNKVDTNTTNANGSFSYTPTQGDGTYRFYTIAEDNAGNREVQPPSADVIVTVTHDTAAPTSTASAKNADNSTYNSGDWTKQNVTVSLSATDSGSGVKEIVYSIDGGANTTVSGPSASVAITTEGAKTIKYHAVDNSGNAEADSTFTVKIDKTAPSITVGSTTAQPNAAGWYKTDVTNNFSASDGLSGLADASQASFQKSSSTEGSAVTISSGTVADQAGNVATSKDAGPFKIDKTAPVISGADVNDTTWRNTDRSADFMASDALSGLSAAADASFTLTASAESQGANAPTTVSKTVTDQAGNSSTRSLSALIDKTKPVITDQGPTPATPDGQNGWYVHPVTNNFSASDGLSGFAGQSDPYTISKSSGTNEGTAVKIASGSVTDKAGNTATSIDSVSFKIDTKAPAAPSALDLLASSDTGSSDTDNTTQDTTPTFSVKAEPGSMVKLYKGTDNTPIGSAVADASGVAEVTTNVLADGTYTIDATATDDAGNVSALSSTIQVTIDVTVDTAAPLAPTGLDMAAASDTGSSNSDDITSDASPVISGNAEKGSDVKLYDGTNVVGSAKANATTGDWSITTSVLAEGDRTLTAKATDTAGNTSVASGALKVTVDKSAPVIKNDAADATFSTPNAAGWYKTDVRNKFSATDNVALADATQASFTKTSSMEGTAVTIASGSVTDKAGNTAASIDSAAFKIDKTAPSISDDGPTTTPNANGWYKADVINKFSASDGLSGLANTADANFTKTTSGEGAAVKVASGSVSDVAGNTAASIDSKGFQIDKTKPVLDAKADVSAEATGSNGANVTYTKPNATEALSGLTAAGIVCQPASGALFPLGSTQVNCYAEDEAGNAADSTHFNVNVVDSTAPALNLPENKVVEATGPNGAPVSFTRTASDLVDGNVPVSCFVGTTPVHSGDTFSLGITKVDCSATDAHNNTARDSFTVTVQDTTAPQLSLPQNISKLATGNSVANVTYSASANDMVDGDVTVNCTPPSGSNVAVGTTTVNCSATDSDNNTARGSFTVTVNYNWTGFFQPIDNFDASGKYILNVAKAGSTIPVKFSLGGDQGMNVLMAGSPTAGKITCSSTMQQDTIEELSTATNSGLKYDPVANQYIYNWKTASSYAGTCQQLVVKLADGTVARADFKFTK